MQPLSLYIHWPFCRAKCPYCDFNSHVRASVDHAAWRQALLAELLHMASLMPGRRLSSIFFGGGTPSLMEPATAEALISAAARHWPMDKNCEITLECNPTSAESASFAAFRAAGVNRASLGVQAIRDQREVSVLAGPGRLRVASPPVLLDDCSAFVVGAAGAGVHLLGRRVAREAPDVSLAVLVTGAVPDEGDLRLGAQRVDYAIPNRFIHGYGLSPPSWPRCSRRPG